MNDLGPRFPQWWNEHIDAAWLRSRAAAITDWNRCGHRSLTMDASIEVHALAFGHGARSAYPGYTSWDVISPRLRADWAALGNVGPAAWDHVADIVRHEWRRAAGPGGDAAPETSPSPEPSPARAHGAAIFFLAK